MVGDGGLILRQQPDASWARETSHTPAQLLALIGDGNGGIYAAGEDGVLLASAGDGIWSPASGIGSGQANTLRAAWSLESDVFLAGDYGTVLRRGRSGWAAERARAPVDVYALAGAAPEDLFAVGEAGAILHRSRR
jgi:hypothetical protein